MKKAFQVYQQYISNSEIYGSATGKKMGTDRWRHVPVQLHEKKVGLLVEGGFSQNPRTSLRCGGVRPT